MPETPSAPSPAAPEEPGIDDLLDRLEAAMNRLADGTLPLDELLAADEEQWRLVSQVQRRLRELMARLDLAAGEPLEGAP